MRGLLRERNVALLWCAGLISMIGDWVFITALPFSVYEQTGSTLAAGGIWLAAFLPGLLLGSVAGVFVDRWDRRRTLVAVDLLQAALLLLFLLVGTADWLWLLYAVTFVQSCLGKFFAPAENALLPRLVGEERLLAANALNSLNDNLARVIGPSLGGLLLGLAGLQVVVLIDSLSFLIAAGLIALIAAPPGPARAQPERISASTRWVAIWREWVDGLRMVRRNDLLMAVFVVAGTAALADSMLTGLLVPFVDAVAQGGAQALGVILTVRGIAGLIGGVVIGRIGPRVPPGRLLAWSLIAIGLLFLVEVNVPYIPLILGITLLLGPPVIGWLTSQQTLLQAGATDEYRGRVVGAYGTTSSLMLLTGTGLASLLGDVVGIVPLLNAAGGLYILAGVLALTLLRGARVQAAQAVPGG